MELHLNWANLPLLSVCVGPRAPHPPACCCMYGGCSHHGPPHQVRYAGALTLVKLVMLYMYTCFHRDAFDQHFASVLVCLFQVLVSTLRTKAGWLLCIGHLPLEMKYVPSLLSLRSACVAPLLCLSLLPSESLLCLLFPRGPWGCFCGREQKWMHGTSCGRHRCMWRPPTRPRAVPRCCCRSSAAWMWPTARDAPPCTTPYSADTPRSDTSPWTHTATVTVFIHQHIHYTSDYSIPTTYVMILTLHAFNDDSVQC